MDTRKIYGPRVAAGALFFLLVLGGQAFGQTPTENAADGPAVAARRFLPKRSKRQESLSEIRKVFSEPVTAAFEPTSKDIDKIPVDITDREFTNGAGDAPAVTKSPSSYVPGRSSGRWVIPHGATEYGVEFGFAPQVATWMSGPKYYDTSDRQHLLGSVRWGKILGTRAFVTYSWAIEIQPINIALGNEVDNPRYLAGSVGEPRRNYEATYGVGINPASFRFIFFPQYRLRPMLGAGFGIVRHLKRVPTVEGTKFNFQADFQIGGQYMLKENKALNFGYRYYHLSNLYLFNFNPGYNVNMFFVGYSVFK